MLADDLDSPDAGLWTGIDLFSLFDQDDILPDVTDHRLRWLSRLDLVRNLLLFLPILFTWTGLFFAVRAYRDLLDAPTAEQAEVADATFLQLWVDGFAGRTWVTFDVVAGADALAILLVIAVAGAAGWLRRRVEAAQEVHHQERARELRVALTEAELVMASTGYDAPDRFAENLKELAPVYKETLQKLTETQSELSESLAQAAHVSVELTRTAGELTKAGTVLVASADDLEQRVNDVGAEVAGLGSRLAPVMGAATSLDQHVQSVHQELKVLVNRFETLNGDQVRIAQDWAAMADNPRAASRAAAETARAAEGTAQALSESVAKLPALLDQVRDALLDALAQDLDERRAMFDTPSAVPGAGPDTPRVRRGRRLHRWRNRRNGAPA